MTLAMFVIGLLAMAGLACVGFGICHMNAEWLFGAAAFFVIALIALGTRSQSEQYERKYELCVKEGKEVIEILERDVCKL